MQVGDTRLELPSVDCEVMLSGRQKRPCRVVYIHPLWRFYTVEFTTVLGWKFRQSYFFEDKEPGGPPLPEELRNVRKFGQFGKPVFRYSKYSR